MKLKRILVPVDFSAHARAAVEAAVELAAKFESELTLLHVWAPPAFLSPEISLAIPGFGGTSLQGYAISEAVREMGTFVKELRLGDRVQTRVEYGQVAETILRTADELPADLIVIGTHGLTGLDRMLMGSVAQKVVPRAACPVLTVKAR